MKVVLTMTPQSARFLAEHLVAGYATEILIDDDGTVKTRSRSWESWSAPVEGITVEKRLNW